MNNNELNIFATHFTHDIYMSPRSLNPSTPLLPNKRLQCVSHCWRRLLGRGTSQAISHSDCILDLWTTQGKAHSLTWFKGQVCSQESRAGELSAIKDWDLLHQRHFWVVYARLLCSAGITNENEFHTSSSPTLCALNDVTSGHTHSLCSEIWLL